MASTSYTGRLYETFGTFKDPCNERVLDTKGEPVEVPYEELQTGVKHVEVHVYGDSLDAAFVHVIATTQERATEVFNQTLINLNRNIKEWTKTND